MMPLETPLETIYCAAKYASDRGAKVLLDPAPAQVLDQDLLSLVDVLLPNEYELALMTGLPPLQSADDVQTAAEILLSLGLKNLIVTLGGQGAVLFNENQDRI